SESGFFNRMWQLGKPHWNEWSCSNVNSCIDDLNKKDKHVLIYTGYVITLTYRSAGDQVYHLGKETLTFTPMSMFVRHGSPFKTRFEQMYGSVYIAKKTIVN